MGEIVPKGSARKVIDIGSRQRGRPGGLGYDPKTGRAHQPATYRPDDGEFDVFAVIPRETGYRPDRFYTSSLNEHHHGERMQVRVPQGIDSQILAAVNIVSQYRSPHDFWRDAAVHRLEWVQHHYDVDDSVRRFLELERMEADSDRAREEVRTMTASVENLNAALAEHYEAEDWQMFADELVRGDERVLWLREPYKNQAGKVLKEWRTRGKEHVDRMSKQREE